MKRRPYSFELVAERSLTPLHDRRVLDAIHRHQNPARCDTAKYLVHSLAHRHNGFGSTLHVLSAILGVAMQNNRILIVTRLDRSAGCGGNCTLFADLCYGEW